MKPTRRSRRPPAERRAPRPAVVTIESIAAGGDGVARTDGLVVFVPRTAPGDVAEIEFASTGRFARGTLRRLRTASPDRVAATCPHYERDHCGGCQLQHLSYGAQLAAKGRIVADALRRIARRELPIPNVIPSPDPWRYRRKLTLAMRRRDRTWIAGLHPFDDPAGVFALEDCPITSERVLDVWRQVLAATPDLPDAQELRGAVIADEAGASFALEGGAAWPRSEAFFAATPALRSLWWTGESGTRRRLHSREGVREAGASFVQVNPGVAAAMEEHVLARIASFSPGTVVDAYAGFGATAIAAARAGARVTAIELDADAAAACAALLPAGSRAIAARVEDVLPDVLPADVVVINPPRAGVDARVCATLERASGTTRAVCYVSCDPATLARDLARLPSWRIADVTCFDMFPQTAHVETVCTLLPEGA